MRHRGFKGEYSTSFPFVTPSFKMINPIDTVQVPSGLVIVIPVILTFLGFIGGWESMELAMKRMLQERDNQIGALLKDKEELQAELQEVEEELDAAEEELEAAEEALKEKEEALKRAQDRNDSLYTERRKMEEGYVVSFFLVVLALVSGASMSWAYLLTSSPLMRPYLPAEAA